jgi:hypothetical protein
MKNTNDTARKVSKGYADAIAELEAEIAEMGNAVHYRVAVADAKRAVNRALAKFGHAPRYADV